MEILSLLDKCKIFMKQRRVLNNSAQIQYYIYGDAYKREHGDTYQTLNGGFDIEKESSKPRLTTVVIFTGWGKHTVT